jgi:hypothetical protein
MRTPGHRHRRGAVDVPVDVDLGTLASRVSYVGSAEHKTYPSQAGQPRPRADATKCDPDLHGDFDRLTDWLRAAVRAGAVGAPWEGDFPRYIWVRQDGVCYEGRLVNRGQGTYKGYEISEDRWPVVLP